MLQKHLLATFHLLNATRSGIKQGKGGKRGVFYLKARAITSGETPQKSLILPPVHISVINIFTLNICIYYKNVRVHEVTFCQKV